MSSTRFDEDIWLLERVSLGASFELFLAFWPEENDKVLIKKVRDDLDPEKKADAQARLLKEAATLEEFWSPYFPKIYDIRHKKSEEDQSENLYLIVQYFAGISLRDYLNLHLENKTITHYFIENFIHEMDHILNYLHHKKGIVHLDISPDNIIVTQDNKIRLIDFEDSRKDGTPLDPTKIRGKEQYLSPELMKSIQFEQSCVFEPKWDLYAYAKTIEELCQSTKGLDKIKCLGLRKKIRSLKKKTTFSFNKTLLFSLPKLPSINTKYLTSGFVTVVILGLTLLGLELLGRSQSRHTSRVDIHNRQRITARTKTLKPSSRSFEAPKRKYRSKVKHKPKKIVASQTTQKKKTRKKVKVTNKKVARTPSLPTSPLPLKTTQKEKVLESKPQVIVQTKSFQRKFNKLISAKGPYLKECMSYESSRSKGQLSLSFHLRATQGRAQKISFKQATELNQLTKSCLMALYADIVFPQHPSRKEVEIVQHFTFSNDSSQNNNDDESFLL